MKISVLGMGRMGRALAGRLVDQGHDVTIWNRSKGKAPELLDRGVSEADSPAGATAGADIVLSILSDDDAVRTVATGGDGAAAALGPSAVYVDCSTVSPALGRELEETISRFVSMPILGAPSAVASGQAIYLIGGGDDAAVKVTPLFPGLAAKHIRYARAEKALTAKLAVNLLLLDGIVTLSESFAVGRAGGLDDDELRQLLGDSPMVPPGWKNRFEGVLTGEQDTWWTTALGAKDAGLAVDLAASAGVELWATRAVRHVYSEAAAEGPDGADIATVGRRYTPGRRS